MQKLDGFRSELLRPILDESSESSSTHVQSLPPKTLTPYDMVFKLQADCKQLKIKAQESAQFCSDTEAEILSLKGKTGTIFSTEELNTINKLNIKLNYFKDNLKINSEKLKEASSQLTKNRLNQLKECIDRSHKLKKDIQSLNDSKSNDLKEILQINIELNNLLISLKSDKTANKIQKLQTKLKDLQERISRSQAQINLNKIEGTHLEEKIENLGGINMLHILDEEVFESYLDASQPPKDFRMFSTQSKYTATLLPSTHDESKKYIAITTQERVKGKVPLGEALIYLVSVPGESFQNPDKVEFFIDPSLFQRELCVSIGMGNQHCVLFVP